MSLYVFGSTAHGELGLGGIEDEQILAPRKMDWLQAADVIHAACGSSHTLLLTKLGLVFSCGSNDYGQLGHDMSRKRPQIISTLENYKIVQIACGMTSSMALDQWGTVFTWGSNSLGQLGHETSVNVPKPVKALATKHIVQIASGHYHCLALTNTGELYSWGANSYGQLGIGNVSEKSTPRQITSLFGVPMAFITCGGNHSFVVSKSGSVYGWGKNLFGQLGTNDNTNRIFPTHLKSLRSLGVRYVTAGDDFSMFLTSDGRVFSTGAGSYGQLGNGTLQDDYLPKIVLELMGTVCTQISTGRRHTLTFVPSRGRIYAFGLGSSGQLGNRSSQNSTLPQVVVGPWVSPSGTSLIEKDESEVCTVVHQIFSGGDQSFVSTKSQTEGKTPVDFRIYEPTTQIVNFSESMAESCSKIGVDDVVDLDLISTLETIFKSQACINASFHSNTSGNFNCTSGVSGVDVAAAEKAFNYIAKVENDTLKQIFWDGVTNYLLTSLQPSPPDVEALRIYLILPLYHEFANSKHYQTLHCKFCKAILQLTSIPQKIVLRWWCSQSSDYFERLVEIFKSVAWYIINRAVKIVARMPARVGVTNADLRLILNVMKILFQANNHSDTVPYSVFTIPDLTDFVDLRSDYVNWLMDTESSGSFMCNYPFLFDAKAKTLLLDTDQTIQMGTAISNSSYTFGEAGELIRMSPYVEINVSRDNLVDDTIKSVTFLTRGDLKKPLRVKFIGEEAEDAGGVRKEFFMLLLKDLLDPKYGMFKEYEETRAIWFSSHSFEEDQMYLLIGILCGLAMYNFTIIYLPFPLCLYKKLLNEPVDISDLRDLSPTLANSLQSILDYEGDDLESVFGLFFEITQEIFGETKQVLLIPNGDKIPVTKENKKEFVTMYIDYILNKSVEIQFGGFRQGFMKVCGGRVLELFQASELMAVIIGNENYDWDALEAEAQYKNGYSSGDQVIRWFWEVFHELPLGEKKKFLLYLTGSDRIPIQGMKAIKIYFQPTTDEKFLPVAHTCFNLLDLPRYSTKERLKYKLCQAIQQTQGFSLV